MTIETGLLMLESILLVVTIILLIYSIKEGRAGRASFWRWARQQRYSQGRNTFLQSRIP